MKTRSTLLALLSTSLVAAAAATTASAQPSAAVAPAPQTHDWNDVNHVNGQVVPVGETNSYEKKFRRTNISTNPIGLIVGFYGLSASYAINDHLAVRADANYFKPIDSHSAGMELGVGLPIYLRRTYQGAFVEPGLIVREMHSDCADCYDDSSDVTVGPQVLFGWHWTWDSGLNVAAAIGAGRNLYDTDADYGDEQLFANGYFRVGYAF